MDTGHVFEPEAGELVVDVLYWEKLLSSGRWFIPREEKGIVRVKHLLEARLEVLGITEENMLPRGYPQGIPPLQNSKKCRTQETEQQLVILNKAKFIPETTIAKICAEVEKRKVLDYEIIQEENDWEMEENNIELTENNPLLSAINWKGKND